MSQIIYDIRPFNIQCHIDLETDLEQRSDGLFTFILHVNNGDIVDYVVMDHENYKESDAARNS